MEIAGWVLKTILVWSLIGIGVAALIRLARIWLREPSRLTLIIIGVFGVLIVWVTWTGLEWILSWLPGLP
jgi:hypothetical protein